MDNDVTEGEAIIPEEDFREAIAACCEDPQLKRYFTLAPTGAKLFIGLGFYSTHFGDRVDPRQYAECQAEIEPALTINDLKYLIRFEDDRNTKQYLRTLLAKREEEEAAGQAEEGEAVAYSAEDPMPVPRRLEYQLAVLTPPVSGETTIGLGRLRPRRYLMKTGEAWRWSTGMSK